MCSTSNKTINQQYCKVKPINRSTSYLNMECYYPKPLKSVFVKFNVSYRPPLGDKFRYILGMKELNGCNILRTANESPLLKPMLIFANETVMQGLIRTCPYPAGLYTVVNASLPRESGKKLQRMHVFPNGDYRIIGSLYNRQDDNIFTINLVISHSWRQNHLNGNDNF